ncbi:MAG TPA: cupin domain-containing protein [Kiritimatiellia bacterium]|nr:cupin domain-containing protein [Kiritimatiellia bacterium]HMO99219.1 cupin domain-containing protein [Kiritimatiellia bacterium]HMP96010.1 cupin domain-containing protein [Kiritimatiellia bacterium]
MATQAAKWVLGHRAALVETQDRYGMVYIRTPPHTPGPPPHYHEDATELFLVIRGELNVVCDGHVVTLGPGQSYVAPKGSVHTFANNGDTEAEWVTSYAPDGFQTFFADFGIDATESGARERSVAPDLLRRVGAECGNYGMILAEMPQPGSA